MTVPVAVVAVLVVAVLVVVGAAVGWGHVLHKFLQRFENTSWVQIWVRVSKHQSGSGSQLVGRGGSVVEIAVRSTGAAPSAAVVCVVVDMVDVVVCVVVDMVDVVVLR